MKKLILLICLVSTSAFHAQKKAFGDGEWFKFRVHYGFVTAGYATLEVNDAVLNGKEVYHIKGEGKTIGMSKWFFKVEDDYQSYIDKEKDVPYRFIRKIDEGGYTKDIQIDFNRGTGVALVHNKEKGTKDFVTFSQDAQDMVSAFYFLRNHIDGTTLKEGDTVDMDMFFDKESFRFRLKFLGKEVLRTRFGKINTLKFRPYVEAGRVFKEKESLTVWVTDDDNKIPLLIKAELAVGSLKATLTEFKGLQHSFKIIVD
ncbi:MAG: ATP-dependent exonuclease [Flavobacteriaceae bacterium]|nr:ATP-dependent exonuclease [Flavobacteriaceae bacterium]|tara:strand:- start:67409 stop:68179 length:771 start_codon:yes stop_codon:yes gene_type:complete